MHTACSLINLPYRVEQVSKIHGFRVTERDLDIIEFILEMKFSTIEDIHSKFFKIKKIGEQSSCLRWARERIANLVKSEFLETVKDVCHRTLYIVTVKGFLFLKNSRFGKVYPRPLASVDGRTYDHDQLVIQIRTTMEEKGFASNWISERQLGEREEFRKYLPVEFRPDGIYEASNKKKVAFELEIARKAKDRYQQKVKKYIHIITESGGVALFDEVHFVCEKETVMNLIKDQTALFQAVFKFTLLSEIIN
jgi:hypothetical protein